MLEMDQQPFYCPQTVLQKNAKDIASRYQAVIEKILSLIQTKDGQRERRTKYAGRLSAGHLATIARMLALIPMQQLDEYVNKHHLQLGYYDAVGPTFSLLSTGMCSRTADMTMLGTS